MMGAQTGVGLLFISIYVDAGAMQAAGSTACISARHRVPTVPGWGPALLRLNYTIRKEMMM